MNEDMQTQWGGDGVTPQQVVYFMAAEGDAVALGQTLIDSAVSIAPPAPAPTNYQQPGLLFTPLHAAAMNGQTDCVRLLIVFGADVEALDFHKNTPMQWAAWKSHPAIVEAFLLAGAAMEATDDDGDSALSSAASAGCLESTEALVAHGANMDIRNNNNETPLMYALEENRLDCAAFLIACGATTPNSAKSNRALLADSVSRARAILASFGREAVAAERQSAEHALSRLTQESADPHQRLRACRLLGALRAELLTGKREPCCRAGLELPAQLLEEAADDRGVILGEWDHSLLRAHGRIGGKRAEELAWAQLARDCARDAATDAAAQSLQALEARPHSAPAADGGDGAAERARGRSLFAAVCCVRKWGELIQDARAARDVEEVAAAAFERARTAAAQNLARVEEMLSVLQ